MLGLPRATKGQRAWFTLLASCALVNSGAAAKRTVSIAALPGKAASAAPQRNPSQAAQQSQKPSFIFILADDLGSGDLGCYGQKLIQSPRIDRMAREGMRFTQCYAGSPVCAPSRNVLMTGFHTGHTRFRDNSPRVGGVVEAFGEGQRRLSLRNEDVTIGEVLQRAGYATGITGKWGLAEPQTPDAPNRQGFDEWFGYLN